MNAIERLIIAGGRDYRLTAQDLMTLDGLGPVLEVVIGSCDGVSRRNCRGVDRDGERWAECRGIPIKRFPADWALLGRRAVQVRNEEMAEYATAAILFQCHESPSMECLAIEEGLTVWVVGPQLELA